MPTAKQRYTNGIKKEAISTMEMLIRKIKAGKMEIRNQGFWRGMPGNYTFKIDVTNLEEVEDSSEDSEK